jgi:hypothetical protein
MSNLAEEVRAKYDLLIGPLREVARNNGYALAVHGSIARDIDLVAVPWTDVCSHPACLAEAIMNKAEEVNGIAVMKPEESGFYFINGCPGAKAHGRLVWTFHLGGGPYIDLSVVPPTGRPVAMPSPGVRDVDDDRKKKLSEDAIAKIREWNQLDDPNVEGSNPDHILSDLLATLGFGAVVEEYWKNPDGAKSGSVNVRR